MVIAMVTLGLIDLPWSLKTLSCWVYGLFSKNLVCIMFQKGLFVLWNHHGVSQWAPPSYILFSSTEDDDSGSFKMGIQKPVGDIMVATATFYTANGSTPKDVSSASCYDKRVLCDALRMRLWWFFSPHFYSLEHKTVFLLFFLDPLVITM